MEGGEGKTEKNYGSEVIFVNLDSCGAVDKGDGVHGGVDQGNTELGRPPGYREYRKLDTP